MLHNCLLASCVLLNDNRTRADCTVLYMAFNLCWKIRETQVRYSVSGGASTGRGRYTIAYLGVQRVKHINDFIPSIKGNFPRDGEVAIEFKRLKIVHSPSRFF